MSEGTSGSPFAISPAPLFRLSLGAGACAIVFSTTDRASFEAVDSWKRKVEDECGAVVMALVQNKVDLMSEAKMTPAEVEAAARRLGVRLYRACVKDNVNVSEVFDYLATQVRLCMCVCVSV